MPKIQVNEMDLSWYFRQREANPVTVLVPGVATFGPNEPTLVDETNFTKIFGNGPLNSEDLSYNMAYSFIKSGLGVMFWRVDLGGLASTSLVDKLQTPQVSWTQNYFPGTGTTTTAISSTIYVTVEGIKVKVVPDGTNISVYYHPAEDPGDAGTGQNKKITTAKIKAAIEAEGRVLIVTVPPTPSASIAALILAVVIFLF